MALGSSIFFGRFLLSVGEAGCAARRGFSFDTIEYAAEHGLKAPERFGDAMHLVAHLGGPEQDTSASSLALFRGRYGFDVGDVHRLRDAVFFDPVGVARLLEAELEGLNLEKIAVRRLRIG